MVFVHLGLHNGGSNNPLGMKANTANFIFFIIFMSREFRHDAGRFCVLSGTNYYRKVLKISFKAKIRTSQGR